MTDWGERVAGLERVDLGDGVTLHVARRFNARRRGLAKLDDLPDEHPLHILRTSSIHTFGMRFALDLLWLDKHGEVLRVDRDVARWRMRTCVRARSVIETRAGSADATRAAYDRYRAAGAGEPAGSATSRNA